MRPTILFLLLAALTVPALPALAQTDSQALALRLLNSQGCKACHRINEAGASVAPDLDKVGRRLTREQLRAKLINPRKTHANGRIADFSHLQKHEIDALTTYLSQHQ